MTFRELYRAISSKAHNISQAVLDREVCVVLEGDDAPVEWLTTWVDSIAIAGPRGEPKLQIIARKR